MLVCSDSHFLVNVHFTVSEWRSPAVHFKMQNLCSTFMETWYYVWLNTCTKINRVPGHGNSFLNKCIFPSNWEAENAVLKIQNYSRQDPCSWWCQYITGTLMKSFLGSFQCTTYIALICPQKEKNPTLSCWVTLKKKTCHSKWYQSISISYFSKYFPFVMRVVKLLNIWHPWKNL